MSEPLDLTEAIKEAARALYGDLRSEKALAAACGLIDASVVSAIAPIIVRQVREQVARAIEAMTVRGSDNRLIHATAARARAARIARGES